MKPRRRPNLALLLFAFLTLLLPLALLQARQPDADADAVAHAWELAQASGAYGYRSQVEQVVYPRASLANAGRGARQDRLALEGRVGQGGEALELLLWQGAPGRPEEAVALRVEGGKTYRRQGVGEWQAVEDDSTSMLAPGGDPLSFLGGLRDVTSAGSQELQFDTQTGAARNLTLSYARYTFTLDGPTFAQSLQAKLEAQLRAGGALPQGVTIDAAAAYRDMRGSGQLWLDADGLPRRLLLTIDIPPSERSGRTSVTIDNEYFDFDHHALALASTSFGDSPGAWLSYRLSGYASTSIALAQRALLCLACVALLALAVRSWRSRRVYAATVISVVLSMLLTPLAQAAQVRGFVTDQRERQVAQQAGAERHDTLAAARKELARSNWDPHQDPALTPLPPSPVATGEGGEGAISPLPALQASSVITSTDTDGDGLSDADEAAWETCAVASGANCAGVADPKDTDGDGLTDGAEVNELTTFPSEADTDGDTITDTLEVRGFLYQGKTWYLDPNTSDTNNDGLIDGSECPSLSAISGGFNEAAACRDLDGDGSPDVFDTDNDGDGVHDQVDLSPNTVSSQVYSADSPLSLRISDLETHRPVLVDVQLRPTNPRHIQLLGNVMDWPSGDTEGQIRRRLSTTFATTANSQLRSSDIRADNGDIRLVPMLEVKIPYTAGHYGDLPVTSAYSGTTRALATSLSDWLDTSKLSNYGITVKQDSAGAGDLTMLAPLMTVADETGSGDVAFASQLVYWPSQGVNGRATWGADHQLRLIWMVQMLTDECSDETKLATCQDSLTVIHIYDDEWTLTGMQVSEEHGLDVGIIYEDPADDDNLKLDDELWLLSWNLSNTFLTGRDCDAMVITVCQSNGARDVTISTLRSEIDEWSSGDNDIGIRSFVGIYPHSGYMATIMMTETKSLLNQVFTPYAGQTTPTLLFAQEKTQRQLNLDAATVSGGAVSFSFDPDDVVSGTSAQLSWAPYTYSGGTWQNADVQTYSTALSASLSSISFFQAEDSTQESVDAAEGKRIWAQLYYIALFKGADAVVAAGDETLWTDPGDGYDAPGWQPSPSGKGSSYVAGVYAGAVGTFLAKKLGFRYGHYFVKAANLGKLPQTKPTFWGEFKHSLQKFRKKFSFFKLLMQGSKQRMMVAFGVLTAITVGLTVLHMAGVLSGNQLVEDIAYYALNTLSIFLTTVYVLSMAHKIVDGLAKGRTFVNALLKFTKSKFAPGAIISAVISIGVSWIMFGIQVGMQNLHGNQLNYMLAATIASTIISIIFTLLSFIPIVGLLVQLFMLVELILAMLKIKGAQDYMTEWMARAIFSIETVIDNFDNSERLEYDLADVSFTNPDAGFTTANGVVVTVAVTNELSYRNPYKFGYSGALSREAAKKTSLRYVLQRSEIDQHGGMGLDKSTADWASLSGSRIRMAESITSQALSFSELGTGLNRSFEDRLYLTEAYALPMEKCWVLVSCEWQDTSGSNHFELGQFLTYDILPQTLDSFVKLDWNPVGALAFPQQKDVDGDGLRNVQSGGTDPDDTKADTDGDGLKDYQEYIKGYNLLLADSDGDGLGDARELFIGSNPLNRDSDGDGLSDYVEVEEGWLIAYTTAGGARATTRIWSDPAAIDLDEDTITDLNEFAFGLNPYVAEDPSVIENLVQFNDMHVEEQGSPRLLLHLEESTNATAFADGSGQGSVVTCGTPAGSCPASGAAGRFGSALSFDGGNDFLQLARPVTDDFTIAFWLKTSQATGAMTQWYQGKGLVDGEVGGATNDFGVTLGNAGQVMFGVGSGSSPFDITIKGGSVANGAWHHVAATRVKASGAMALYVDGALVAGGTGSTASLTAPPALRLGMLQTGLNPFAGTLDEVVIYDRALAAGEVASLMGGSVDVNDLVVLPGAELSYASTISNTHQMRTADGLLTVQSDYIDPRLADPGLALPFDAEDRMVTFSNVARLSGGATCVADLCPSTTWINGGDRAAIFDGVDDRLDYPRHAIEQRGSGGGISFAMRIDALPGPGKTAQIFTTDTKAGAISMYLTPAGKLMTRIQGSSSYDYAIQNPNGTTNQLIPYAGYSEHYSTRTFSAGPSWISVDFDYLIFTNHDPIDDGRTWLTINGVPDSEIRWQSFPDEVTVGPGVIANDDAGAAPFQGGLNSFSGGWTMTLGFDEDLVYAFDRFNNAASYGDSGAAMLSCASAASCPTYTTSGKTGAGAIFDGVDDYLPLSQGLSFTDNDTGSLSFWVKLNAVPASGRAYVVDSSCANNVRCMDFYFDSNGRFTFDLITNGVASTLRSDYMLHMALGQWKLITASWTVGASGQPAVRTLNVDGVVNQTSGETGSSIPLVFAPNARLGQALAGGSGLSATIDDLKMSGVIDGGTRTIYDVNFTAPAYDVAQLNSATGGRGAACPTYGECPLTTGPGVYGEALSFDGINDRLVAPYETRLGQYTMAAWVKTDAVKAQNILLLTDTFGTQSAQLRLMSDGRFQHVSNGQSVAGTTVAQPDTWYHVAGVVESDRTVRLYVDGVEEGTPRLVGSLASGAGYRYEIGAASPGYAFFDGMIDEVMVSPGGADAEGVGVLMAAPYPALIFDAPFTTAEIAAGSSVVVGGSVAIDPQAASGTHRIEQEASAAIEMPAITYPVADGQASQLAIALSFDQPPGTTAFDNIGQYTTSPQHPNAVCSGSACPVAGLRGHVDRAAYFDGLDDRLTLPGSTSTLDFQTVAAWVKADSEGGTILSSHDTLGIQLTTNSFMVRETEIAYELVDNVWTHVVATYNRGTGALAVYVNGVLQSSGTRSGSQPSMSWPTIGSRGVGNNVLLGYLDDLRVYMSVLSASQVQTLYKQSAAALRFEFDEESGATVYNDSSSNGYVGYPEVETCNTFEITQVTTELLPHPNRGFRLRLGSSGAVLWQSGPFPPDGSSYPLSVGATLCADDTLIYEVMNEDTDFILIASRPLNRALTGLVHDSNEAEQGQPSLLVDYRWGTPRTTITPLPGTDGKIGNTALFAAEGAITVSDASAVGALTNGFTVMGWVKPETLIGSQALIGSGIDVSSNGFSFGLNAGKLRLNGFGRQDYASTVAVDDDVWQHVAVVFDGSYDATFYLNGAAKQTVLGNSPLLANADDPLYIGAGVNGAGVRGEFFLGELDELAIYPRAFATSELYSVYLRELRWFSDRASSYVKIDAESPTIELLSDHPYRANAYTQLAVQTADDSYVQLLDFGLKGPGMGDYVWTSAPVCEDKGARGILWCPAFDPTALGGQGAYQLKFRAVDAVGHETTSAVYTLYVDGSGPSAGSAYNGGALDLAREQGEELAWRVDLSGSIGDPAIGAVAGSGVYTPTVAVALYDGKGDLAGTGVAQAASVDGAGWSLSYRFSGIQPSGIYTVTVTAEDRMHNRTTTSVGRIRVDERPASVDVDLSEIVNEPLISETLTLQGVVSEQANWSGELLKLHFEEQGGASFDDSGSLELDATCVACPSSAAGIFGRALSFDGVDDALSIPPTTTVELARGSFTIATWLKTSGASRGIITRSDGDASWEQGEKSFYLDSGGRPAFVGHGNNFIRSTRAVNDGGWHHVAVSWAYAGGTSGSGSIYVDGVDVTDRAATNYAANNADNAGDALFIGRKNNQPGEAPNNFAGLLDEMALYGRALSAEEVYALAQSSLAGVQSVQVWLEPIEVTSPISDSALSFAFEEPAGDTSFANGAGTSAPAGCAQGGAGCPEKTSGLFGQALSFDGVDDVLTLTASLTPTQFTLSAWVYPTLADSLQHGIVGYRAEDPIYSAPSLWLFEEGRVRASFGDGGSESVLDTPSTVMPNNAWSHLAATYDGTTYSIYVNGALAASSVDFAGRMPYPLSALRIGGLDTFFAGKLDAVRLYERALSVAEVALLASDDGASGWQDAALSGAGLASAWSYQLPADAEGFYALHTRAADAAGNVGEQSLAWRGAIDMVAPRLAASARFFGSGATAETEYRWSATDRFIDPAALVQPCPAASVVYDSRGANNGTNGASAVCRVAGHVPDHVTFEVCDASGRCASQTMAPSMAADPSNVIIQSPADGSTQAGEQQIVFTGIAYDPGGLDQVQLFANGAHVSSYGFGGGAAEAWSMDWTPAENGIYTLDVVLFDHGTRVATDTIALTVGSGYLLSVSRSGVGSGSVSSSPAGISCGVDCSQFYNSGTSVTLTATPATGSTFDRWDGACSGTSPSCVVTMSQARSVTATFKRSRYALSVSKGGTGSGTVSSSPGGISCGATCSASYDHGTNVVLSAAPAATSTFSGWGAPCSGTGSCTLSMTQARSVTANFTLKQHTLTVGLQGYGGVSSSPAGISCGDTCSASFSHGIQVALTATPDAGWAFDGWEGACTGTGNCLITMDQARGVTARFTLTRHALSVSLGGTGSGSVSSDPAGINCGDTCSAEFDDGTQVTLSAQPAEGSSFAGWEGACSGTESCVVSVDQAQSVTASFSLNRHQLSVSREGGGGGLITSDPAGISCGNDGGAEQTSCGAEFDDGTQVTLTATPASGSMIVSWGGACWNASGDTCQITIDQAQNVTVRFEPAVPLTITFGDEGEGLVEMDWFPICSWVELMCIKYFQTGTVISLTAFPGAGWKFAGWGGACSGLGGCILTMDQARSVRAAFVPDRRTYLPLVMHQR